MTENCEPTDGYIVIPIEYMVLTVENCGPTHGSSGKYPCEAYMANTIDERSVCPGAEGAPGNVNEPPPKVPNGPSSNEIGGDLITVPLSPLAETATDDPRPTSIDPLHDNGNGC